MSGEEIVITFSEPWYKDCTDITYHPLTKELFTKVCEQIYAPKEPVITNTAFDEAVNKAFMEELLERSVELNKL